MRFQEQLGRDTAFARLLLKHRRVLDAPGVGNGEAEEFARDLDRRGATFVKLGQVLSTRGDLLPAEYLEALILPIMLVPTNFRLFGYPGLAMILFILAATGGAMLARQIVTRDRTVRFRQ